jgi:hypothetical protein
VKYHSRKPVAVWVGRTKHASLNAAARALSLETQEKVYPRDVAIAAGSGGKIGGHLIKYAGGGGEPEKAPEPVAAAPRREWKAAPLLRYPPGEAPSERSLFQWK